MSRSFGLSWGLALALGLGLACEIDGSIGRTSNSSGGGSGSAGSGDGGSDAADDSAGSAGEGTSVGDASGGGTSAATVDTRGPTDQPAACHPTPDDSACVACRKTSCCAPLENCLLHEPCLCWWECFATDHSADECDGLCDGGGPLYEELTQCVSQNCDSCVG